MKRRTFIALIGGAAAWPLAARAQQSGMPVIGYFHVGSSAESRDRVAAFHRGLKELGFIEGRDVAIEYHRASAIPGATTKKSQKLNSLRMEGQRAA